MYKLIILKEDLNVEISTRYINDYSRFINVCISRNFPCYSKRFSRWRYCRFINYFILCFYWSPGILTFLLTAVIFAIGYRSLSKRALGLSLLTIPLVSLFMYLTEGMGDSLGDPLVSAMFAGFFSGVGSALILRTGSSMGGTGTIAIMLEQKYDFDMIRLIFIMDIAIVLSGLIVIGPLHVMYTIVNLFVGKKASDLIMDGLDPRKAVSIVSNQADNIADNIIKTMNISATVFD